jgi:hypothetical protein
MLRSLHIARGKSPAYQAPTHYVLRARYACAQHTSVPRGSLKSSLRTYDGPRDVDTDTDPDPAFFLISNPDPGFDDQKLKKFTSGYFFLYFLIKRCNLLIPRLPIRIQAFDDQKLKKIKYYLNKIFN